MVTKSKTRKDKNFRQLVEYIHKDGATTEQSFTYVHNMDVNPNDTEGMIRAFEENDRYRKARKNGVAQYHEYLSFSPKDSEAIKKEPFILQDIAQKYISLRAPNSLAIARPHYDAKHLHLHFLFSGSERESSSPTRISKRDFQQVKDRIWEYQKERYPQLVHSYTPGQKQEQKKERGERVKDTEKEMKKRGARQTIKAQLQERISKFLGIEKSTDFFDALRDDGMEVYKRKGVETGVIHNNRKHRFTTIFKEHPKLETVQHLVDTRKAEVSQSRQTEKQLRQRMGKLRQARERGRERGQQMEKDWGLER